jgi:hypothetical protein
VRREEFDDGVEDGLLMAEQKACYGGQGSLGRLERYHVMVNVVS